MDDVVEEVERLVETDDFVANSVVASDICSSPSCHLVVLELGGALDTVSTTILVSVLVVGSSEYLVVHGRVELTAEGLVKVDEVLDFGFDFSFVDEDPVEGRGSETLLLWFPGVFACVVTWERRTGLEAVEVIGGNSVDVGTGTVD